VTRPFVVYWHKQPTPYFVERCNAIADRGNVELEVWFNTRRESNRSWDVAESDWRFPARYIPTRRWLGQENRFPLPELRQRRPDLLVQEYDRPYLAIGFLAARAGARRTAFRVLTNFDSWSERTWWREGSKHLLFRAVDGAKVGGEDGAALAGRYGLPRDRTWDVTQSVDVAHFNSAADLSAADRARGRQELGLAGTVFVYVGRLWEGKGVGLLLDAYASVVEQGADVSLLLVGDGQDEAAFRERAAELPRVVFAGFQQRDRLPYFYALADVMVFPTLGDPNGLVVEEALAAGLPVVSSTAAGNIARRLPPGGPGTIFPTEDAEALAGELLRLAHDDGLRSDMARQAAPAVAGMSPEAYAIDFERFAEAVLRAPRRRTPAAWLTTAMGAPLLAAGARALGPPTPFAGSLRTPSEPRR
jgi:glycosyltransferase involved in cell wall biosynthesis